MCLLEPFGPGVRGVEQEIPHKQGAACKTSESNNNKCSVYISVDGGMDRDRWIDR